MAYARAMWLMLWQYGLCEGNVAYARATWLMLGQRIRTNDIITLCLAVGENSLPYSVVGGHSTATGLMLGQQGSLHGTVWCH